MKYILSSLLLSIPFFTISQARANKKSSMVTLKSSIQKWTKAIVPLETRSQWTDQLKQEEFNKLRGLPENKKFTDKDIWAYIEKISIEDYAVYTGTALFVKHKNKTFLVTASHVLIDESQSKNKDYVFHKIFIQPLLDKNNPNKPLMFTNLMAGSWDKLSPFVLDTTNDLGIISLNVRHMEDISNELIKSGYEPVDVSDIDSTSEVSMGDDIYCLGFPGNASLIKFLNKSSWDPLQERLPTAVFGKVSMNHESLSKFLADVSIYPGNSGGPVIMNNKLIGIVSSQSTTQIDESPNLNIRIPLGFIVKAKYVIKIIDKLIENEIWLKKNSPLRVID